MINNSNENALMDDANSPELNRKLMGYISEDFIRVSDQLKEASYQIRKRGFSDYPIFVVSNSGDIELGALLFASTELTNRYTYRASMMQEFVDRKLIGEESEEAFKESYKDPEEYCCLFALIGDFSGFVFVPYPED
jgi:phage pi2 protein 07